MAAAKDTTQSTNKVPLLDMDTDYSMWVTRFQTFAFFNEPEIWTTICDGSHKPVKTTADGEVPKTTEELSARDVELLKRDK